MRRCKTRAMPDEFEPLAVYNAERHRGIVHTPEYDERMSALQRRFDAWRRDLDGPVRRDYRGSVVFDIDGRLTPGFIRSLANPDR